MYTKCRFRPVYFIAIFSLSLNVLKAQELPKQLQMPLDTLPVTADLPLAELQQWGILLASRTGDLGNYQQQQLIALQTSRDSLSSAIELAKLDTTMDKKALRSRQKELKSLQSAEKTAARQLEATMQRLAQCSAYNASDEAAQRSTLPVLWSSVNTAEKALLRSEPALENPEQPELSTPARQYAEYSPQNDVMLNPPVQPCTWASNERDAFSGEVRRETARELLFRYTNPNLKAIFGKKPQTICEGVLTQTGEKLVLNLFFTINDPNARNTFGSLNQNSPALFKLIDGSTLTLANLRTDEGVPTVENSGYVYKGQYLLDKTTVKRLAKSGLDKLRLTWATGYEDYDIQNVDYLQRVLNCLN